MSTDQPPSQMGQSVGARIRAARQAKKYTQGQLAAPNFSVSYISAIERGHIQPSLRALEILARRLDLSPTDLFPKYVQSGGNGMGRKATTTNLETLIELELLEAQIAILQGEAEQAIVQLSKLATRRLQDRYQTQHRYLLGWAYLHTAELEKCADVLAEAERLAQMQKDTYSSVRTCNLLGLTYAAMEQYQQALQSHGNCLDLLENSQPRDAIFLCHVYNHMGQHYTHLNDFSSAIDMFKRAIALTEELAVLENVQAMYWNSCQHYASTQRYDLATLYAHKCSHAYSQHVKTPLRSEMYHYLGRAMMKGDQEKARVYLEEALQQEGNLQDSLTQASIMNRLAECCLVHNGLQEAEQYVQRAYELANPFGETIVAAEALLLWGRILYTQERYEDGDGHFVAGLQMLERLGIDDELAEQAAFYGQLLDERNKTVEAIVYYKRALESQRRMRGIV